MRELISEAVKTAKTVEEVRTGLMNTLAVVEKENPEARIGYVAGVITSDGPKHIQRNVRVLGLYTQRVREREGWWIFSAADVFTDEVFEQVNAICYPPHAWLDFWRKVLLCGHIKRVYMTPRWKISKGATDEHQTAKEAGLEIFYEEEVNNFV